jgi:hypothetical protein
MKKVIISTVFTTAVSIGIRLFFGVYHHDEFAEKHLFIKHRPTWKRYFYSPIGMSDIKIEDLSIEEQLEENYFEEFIRRRIQL